MRFIPRPEKKSRHIENTQRNGVIYAAVIEALAAGDFPYSDGLLGKLPSLGRYVDLKIKENKKIGRELNYEFEDTRLQLERELNEATGSTGGITGLDILQYIDNAIYLAMRSRWR